MVSRKTGQVIVQKANAQAYFTVVDSAGNILNSGQNTVKKSSQDVTLAMVQQAESGVQIIVEVDVPF